MHEIILAGFGGQGVLAAGVILAHAAMLEGQHVSWMPSYGAEQRGGTANCTVKLGDEEIGSPFFEEPDILVAMNEPSLDKFKGILKADGLILANSSLIVEGKMKDDPRIIALPFTETAQEMGNARTANVIMLGALLSKVPMVSEKALLEGIKTYFSAKGEKVVALNTEAVKRGSQLV